MSKQTPTPALRSVIAALQARVLPGGPGATINPLGDKPKGDTSRSRRTSTFHRVEAEMDAADIERIKELKPILGARSIAEVFRQCIRIGHALTIKQSQGYEVYLVHKDNRDDRFKVIL